MLKSQPAAGSRRWLLGLCALCFFASSSLGQSSPAHNLLRLVPHEDVGVCILVPDLRGNAQRLLDSPWFKRLEASPLAEGLLRNNPHWTRIEAELKKHLQIDWSELRDDIVGESLVLAYRPAAKDEPEQGLLLLQGRNSSRLARLVDRINDAQRQSGDLKELVPVPHQGKQYFRRVEKGKTNFYYLDGGLLAFSATEAWIRRVIEQPSSTPLVEQFRRSEADRAVASIWLNPRFVASELKQKATSGAAEGLLARSLESTWPALQGILVSAHLNQSVELRVCLQSEKLFTEAQKPSDLWRHFPSEAIVAVAGRVDVPALASALQELLPTPARDGLAEFWKRGLAAAAGVDLGRDLLPNVGPDWGFVSWPSPNHDEWPYVLGAFAVRPGAKAIPVDKSLLKALHVLATFVVVDYNLKHSGSLRLDTVTRDNTQIHYLDDAKLFPPGVRPAIGLKNGYLVFASSPEAIARFGKGPTSQLTANETPLIRVSLAGFATLLDTRREQFVSHVAERNGISPEKARDWLSQVRSVLDHFRLLQLVHRTGEGQSTWVLRVDPR